MSTDLVKHGETRIITVFSQRDNSSKDVHTDVKTWGEFLQQNAQEFNLKNIRGVVRETKHVLEVDDAVMPEGNFTLFLFPKKVKSGLSMKTKDEYLKSEDRDGLRRLCRKRKLSILGGKEKMAERLAKDDRNTEPSSKAPVVHAPTESKAVVKVSTETYATVEAATVETTVRARINDAAQLSSLLEIMFPNMKVVSIDAVVDLTAKLELGTALPAVAPITDSQKEEEKVTEEVEEVKAPIQKTSSSSSNTEAKTEKKPAAKVAKVSKKGPSDEQLKKEANEMKGFF